MSIKTFPVILKDSYLIAPRVKHFVFHCPQEAPFTYIPGQFITIHFEHNGQSYRRSYSIANEPNATNHIEIAASYVENGVGSEMLFSLTIGDQIQISGPVGRLILKNPDPQRYILVATGTGITPYRAMRAQIQARMDQDPAFRVVILMGVRTREDILYHQEFLDWADNCPQLTYRAQLSDKKTTDFARHQYPGYVQNAFAELNLNPTNDLIYLCGNPGMIDESFESLKNQGFSTQHIIREKYISSK